MEDILVGIGAVGLIAAVALGLWFLSVNAKGFDH